MEFVHYHCCIREDCGDGIPIRSPHINRHQLDALAVIEPRKAGRDRLLVSVLKDIEGLQLLDIRKNAARLDEAYLINA